METVRGRMESNDGRQADVADKQDIAQCATRNGLEITLEEEFIDVKPRIGLFGAIAFSTGAVIGTGIFISPRGALQYSGSVGLCLLVWTFCGIISLMIALVYAGLGVIVPKSGGNITYIREGIGEIPAFLVCWVTTFAMSPGGRSVFALVFADYLCAPIFGACAPPDSIRKTIGGLCLVTVATTNLISVRFAAYTQILFSGMKVFALITISIGGFWHLTQDPVETLNTGFEGSILDATSLSLAFYACMWAYSGSNRVNELAEEILQPKRNIPLSLVISMCLITVIYLTTNVSYFALLTKHEFLSSTAVAFQWGKKVLGPAALFMPISVLLSVYGAFNGGIFADGRVRFAAARAGFLPEIFCYLHHQTRIPATAIVLDTFLAFVFLIPGDISSLINMLGFMSYMEVGLSTISYIRLCKKIGPKKNELRIPLFVSVVALLFCVFMLVAPFLKSPKTEFLYGLAFAASGLLLYIPFVYFRLRLPGADKTTLFVQLLLQLCPTVTEKEA